MTDASGKVTLTASYTPWGDLLSIEGEGGFTWGYFGGIMDTATGLLYVGNGQYYDPSTGRFLTRNARPNQSNPYVPWRVDPLGSLISPLALLALIYGRKRKRSKWDTLVILLVVGATMGMSLSACDGNGSTTPTVVVTNEPTINPTGTLTPGSLTVKFTPTNNYGPPTTTPILTCLFTFTPTNTPIPTLEDDDLRIQLHVDFETTDEFKAVVRNEPEALLLARVAIAESTQGNIKELQYIMWTIKIRAAIGYPNYQPGDYKRNPISATLPSVDIKSVILQKNTKGEEDQYAPIVQAFLSPLNAVNNY